MLDREAITKAKISLAIMGEFKPKWLAKLEHGTAEDQQEVLAFIQRKMERLRKTEELRAYEPPSWFVVETEVELNQVIRALDRQKIVFLDFETYAESVEAKAKVIPWEHVPRLLSIHPVFGKVAIIDFYAFIDYRKVLRDLFQVLKNKLLVFHNAFFDLTVWREHVGTWTEVPAVVWDTMIMERFLLSSQGQRPKVPGPSLASLVQKYLQAKLVGKEELAGGEVWRQPKLSIEWFKYAAADAAVLEAIYRAQLDALRRAGWTQEGFRLVCEWLVEHVRMEWALKRQYRINSKYKSQVEKQRAELEKRELEFEKKWGFTSRQLGKIVRKLSEYGVPTENYDKTAKSRLLKEVQAGKIQGEAADLITETIKLSQLKKEVDLLGGYVKADPVSIILGACGSISGRYVCRNPNLLQIPRAWKEDLLVPPDGYVLIRADFPGQEIRIVCHYAEEEKMREVLVEGKHGGDLHKCTASILFEKPIDEVSKEERQIGKACNFLLVYGGTPEGLRRTLSQNGIECSKQDCQDWYAKFFQGYPAIRQWHHQVERKYRAHILSKSQYPVRTPGGRVVLAKCPSEQEWKEDYSLRRKGAYSLRRAYYEGLRRAFNYHGQATGWDIAARAMVLIRQELERKGWLDKVFPSLLIHDELVYLATADIYREVAGILRKCMEQAMDEMLPYVAGGNQVPPEDVLFVFHDGRVVSLAELEQEEVKNVRREVMA